MLDTCSSDLIHLISPQNLSRSKTESTLTDQNDPVSLPSNVKHFLTSQNYFGVAKITWWIDINHGRPSPFLPLFCKKIRGGREGGASLTDFLKKLPTQRCVIHVPSQRRKVHWDKIHFFQTVQLSINIIIFIVLSSSSSFTYCTFPAVLDNSPIAYPDLLYSTCDRFISNRTWVRYF